MTLDCIGWLRIDEREQTCLWTAEVADLQRSVITVVHNHLLFFSSLSLPPLPLRQFLSPWSVSLSLCLSVCLSLSLSLSVCLSLSLTLWRLGSYLSAHAGLAFSIPLPPLWMCLFHLFISSADLLNWRWPQPSLLFCSTYCVLGKKLNSEKSNLSWTFCLFLSQIFSEMETVWVCNSTGAVMIIIHCRSHKY